MKEITISFTEGELVELAKQLYLSSYILIGFPYDNMEMVENISNKVCAVGFHEMPELEAFRHGGLGENLFELSLELSQQCDPIFDQFEANVMGNQLPDDLAARDFQEKYGEMKPLQLNQNLELLEELRAIQEIYRLEFERYGIRHLRLEHK